MASASSKQSVTSVIDKGKPANTDSCALLSCNKLWLKRLTRSAGFPAVICGGSPLFLAEKKSFN